MPKKFKYVVDIGREDGDPATRTTARRYEYIICSRRPGEYDWTERNWAGNLRLAQNTLRTESKRWQKAEWKMVEIPQENQRPD